MEVNVIIYQIDLTQPVCRDAVSQMLTAIINVLDDGFARSKKGKDVIAQQKTTAALLSLHYILQGCNFEESGLCEMLTDDVVRSMMAKMETLFDRLDEQWNPVRSQHRELGTLCNLGMTTVLNRYPSILEALAALMRTSR